MYAVIPGSRGKNGLYIGQVNSIAPLASLHGWPCLEVAGLPAARWPTNAWLDLPAVRIEQALRYNRRGGDLSAPRAGSMACLSCRAGRVRRRLIFDNWSRHSLYRPGDDCFRHRGIFQFARPIGASRMRSEV